MTQAAPAKKIGFVPKPQLREVAGKPPPQLRPTLVEPREEITPGSVLLKNGTAMPVLLRMNPRRFGDWEMVSELDGFAVDRELRQAGWHFFFMVPAVEASAIGVDPQKTFAKALGHITRAVEAQRLNALEVTAVMRRRWLGIEYVKITAHPRHMRNSPFVRDVDPHHYPKGVWDFKRIFDVRNRQAPQIKAM